MHRSAFCLLRSKCEHGIRQDKSGMATGRGKAAGRAVAMPDVGGGAPRGHADVCGAADYALHAGHVRGEPSIPSRRRTAPRRSKAPVLFRSYACFLILRVCSRSTDFDEGRNTRQGLHATGSSCLLPPASCLLPPASCLLHPATCHLPPAVCRLPPASFPLPPASCLLPPASCL